MYSTEINYPIPTSFATQSNSQIQVMDNLDIVSFNNQVIHFYYSSDRYRTKKELNLPYSAYSIKWHLLPNYDLICIRQGQTNIEVDVYDYFTEYTNKVTFVSTFGNGDANNGTWQLMPDLKLYFIKTLNCQSGNIEVHYNSLQENSTNHFPSSFSELDGSNGIWKILENSDLAFIKTANTSNSFVEVHLSSKLSNYIDKYIQVETCIRNNQSRIAWELFIISRDLVSIDSKYQKLYVCKK